MYNNQNPNGYPHQNSFQNQYYYNEQPIGMQQMPYQQPYQQQQYQQQYQSQPIFQGVGYQIGGQDVPPVAPQKYAKDDDVKIEMIAITQSRRSGGMNLEKTETRSSRPSNVHCLNCQRNVITNVTYQLGCGSWSWIIFFLFCFWPLMCLPCCFLEMQDANHYCPYCNAFLGQKKFLC